MKEQFEFKFTFVSSFMVVFFCGSLAAMMGGHIESATLWALYFVGFTVLYKGSTK